MDHEALKHLTRRDFLKRAAAGTAALGLAGLATDEAMAAGAMPGEEKAGEETMPMRTLGKTGEKVSILGFGGGSNFLMSGRADTKSIDDCIAQMERAIAAGINYFDTAESYGNGKSETYYSKVLPKYRKQIFLATKTQDRTYDGAMRAFENSLKRLDTDYLDLYQMHQARPKDKLEDWEQPGGALTALRKLKEQKAIRYIGFTGHDSADFHKKVIETLDYDTVLMALNAAGHKQFREIALPAAVEKNLGIIGMKITRGLVGDKPNKAPLAELLAWAWELPLATIIIGHDNLEMLNENIRLAREFKPGQLDVAALENRLRPRVTAAQLGWAMPGYRDAFV
ncbi:MAG: aldo/keto reductase [Armatimonadota bacterium]|nr:aldo/keto reductase [Armatimonadota bacterium]